MILKKRLQDGKTIYEPISFEEAVEQRAEKSDFVFTDEDEKDKFEDALEELDDLEEEIEDEKDEEKSLGMPDGAGDGIDHVAGNGGEGRGGDKLWSVGRRHRSYKCMHAWRRMEI